MPKHDAPTSEPSLPGFIDWLRSKDPHERYEWPNSRICACGQYSQDEFGKEDWMNTHPTWSTLNQLARGEQDDCEVARSTDWTFGKLLARCEKKLENA